RLALALLPVGEVLGQAGPEFCTVRRVSVDLDEAEDRRDAPEEAQAGSLRVPLWVWVVQEVGVLGVPRDLVLDDGDAGGVEGFLAELLGELIEGVVHGERRVPRRGSAAQVACGARRAPP